MKTYRLSKEEIFQWCSIPKEELACKEGLKVKLNVYEDKGALMEKLGNMMADEVIEHIRKGFLRSGYCRQGQQMNMIFL